MKANKRIIAMLVGVLMIGSMVVGCEKKVENDKTQTQQEVKVTEESKQETKEEKEVDKVVYDENDIKITYTGMEYNKEYDATMMNFKIENNRDEDVTVQSDVNNSDSEITLNDSAKVGYSFSEDLKANETKDFSFVFANEADLKDNGIEKIEKLEVKIMVLHNDYNVLSEGIDLKLDLTE